MVREKTDQNIYYLAKNLLAIREKLLYIVSIIMIYKKRGFTRRGLKMKAKKKIMLDDRHALRETQPKKVLGKKEKKKRKKKKEEERSHRRYEATWPKLQRDERRSEKEVPSI